MGLPLEGGPPIAGVEKPVSRLALGAAFFDLDAKAQWAELLDAFAGQGGAVIDTGRSYGTSEDVIGEWMESTGLREHVILSTKCGHGHDHRLPEDDFEDMVSRELETSLNKLRTNYIDLYVLHRDNPAIPVARIVERLNEEVVAGRLRALGASNWEYTRVEEANDYAAERGLAGFAVVSNHLSLAESQAPFYPGLVSVDSEGRSWHARTGVPLLSWAAQARGFFSGNYSKELAATANAIEDPFTRRMCEVYGSWSNFERLRRAQELGGRTGHSAVEVALSWLLHQTFPVIPVVGPRTVAELESCAAAVKIPMDEDEVRWLGLEN